MKKSIMSLAVAGFAILALSSCGNTSTAAPTTPGAGTSTPAAGTTTPAPTTPGASTPEPTSTQLPLPTIPAGKSDIIVVSGPSEHREFTLDQLEKLAATDTDFANVGFGYLTYGENDVDSKIADWSNGPDVYAYASDKILPLFTQGALSPVSPDYEAGIVAMGEGAEEAATLADRLYAYPYAGDNGYFLYYDSSRVTEDKIGSIEELLDYAQSIGQKVGYPLEEAFYNMGALFTFGADYSLDISEEGTINSVSADFDGEAGIKGGKAILKIMQHPAWQQSQAVPTSANNVIACVNGGWAAGDYSTQMGESYAAAKMPTVTIDGDTKTLGSFLGYKLYGVNPQRGNAQHLALSHKVANYLVSEAVQEARFDELSVVPTNQTVKALPRVAEDKAAKAIGDQSVYAHPQGAVPGTLWGCADTLITGIKANEVTNENMASYMEIVNAYLKDLK